MPFSAVVGHRHAIDLLKQGVMQRRVPQSLLFAGPEGVGKRTVALALAQAVNCPKRTSDGDACGACQRCTRIARGQFSDVTLIDRGDDATIKIKTLRERVLDTIGYRPFEGECRVYIIDGADDMGAEAQDALLKTLEEPPSAAIIILVTAFPDTLLATIQSRGRRLRFGPLSEDDVVRVLVQQHKVDAAKARALAAASGGSVSLALAEDGGDLDDDREAAMGLIAAVGARGVAAKLKAASALVQHGSKRRDREALGARLAIAASLLRDLGAIGAGAPGSLANRDLEGELTRLSGSYDLARVAAGYGVIHRAQAALDRYASPKIVADWLAVTL
jgi:DNA polymerase-3 subunit delta'